MGELYLFSAVDGLVVKEGKPVNGAVINQQYRWPWKDMSGHQQIITNETGQFSFPAIIKNSLLGSLLPHEPIIRQTITIQYQGETYQAWLYDKGNYDEYGELDGKPISLYCELTSPLIHSGDVYGICQLR